MLKTGSGLLSLSGNNSYTGGTTLDSGTLHLAGNSALGTGGLIIGSSTSAKTLAMDSGATVNLNNSLTLGSDLNVSGGGTLNFNGSAITSLGSSGRLINIDTVTNVKFAGGLSGGTLNKSGAGTLILSSGSSTFNGLDVTNGYLNTGNFSGTLTIGATDSGKNYLGTGNITVSGSDSALNLNGAAGSAVNVAGGTILLANGGSMNINNSAATLNAGTIDFGSGAPKGVLNFYGNATLGNTAFNNAANATLGLGGNVLFLNSSTIAGSGINFALYGSGAQLISAQTPGSNLTLAGNLSKTGTGTLTLDASIDTLSLSQNFILNSGILNLGTTTLNVAGASMLNGGSLVFGKNAQFDGALNVAGNGVSLILNGYNQSFSGLSLAGNTGTLLDLGGNSASSTVVNLGNLGQGSNSLLKIKNWDDGTNADVIQASAVTDPASVWFYGYNKGATLTGGVLTPTSFLSAEWNGQATDALWATGGNWVGGDAFNVPDHAGAGVIIGDLAGDLSGKAINLGGNRTVGSILINSSSSTTGSTLQLTGGSVIFDSGTAAASTLTALTSGPWLQFVNRIQLDSDLVINNVSGNMVYVNGVAGTHDLIKNGAGELRFFGLDYAGFTGDIYLNAGTIYTYNDNLMGSGTITVNGGVLSAQFGSVKYSIDNKLVIAGNFTTNNVRYTQVGDIALDQMRTLTVNANTTVAGQVASVTFNPGANFTGAGGLTKAGGGTMEILSPDSTFSGGLNVNGGTLYTTLTSDLTLGALNAGHNYLGSGDVTLTNNNSILSIASAGKNATLAGSTTTLGSGTQLRYLDGGAMTLAGGTITGSGSLLASGDLTFAGTIFSGTPSIVIDTTTNASGHTTVYQTTGAATGLLGNFIKQGAGVTTLDGSLISLNTGNLYANNGLLQFGGNNQVVSSANIVLNGGALSANNYTENLGRLYLRNDSSLILGNSGQFIFASRAAGATDWVDGKALTLQNNGQDWNTGATSVRFASNPLFTTTELSRIAFTGYESGATIDTSLFSGYWTLLPIGMLTNEWIGAGLSQVNWSDTGNWLSNVVPNAAGVSASIRDADPNLNGKTINVDGAFTVGRLNIESSSGQLLTLGGSGTLIFDGNGSNGQLKHAGVNTTTIATNVALNSGINLIDNTAPTSGYLDWAGVVSGNGGVTKTGGGTLRLSNGGNTYAGGFVWQDGSLIQVNADGALFGSGQLTIGNNGGQTYTLETRGGSHSVSNNFVLNGNLTLQRDTDNGVVDPAAIGTGRSLTLSGLGELAAGMNIIDVYANSSNQNTLTEMLTLSLDNTLTGSGGLYKTGYGSLVLNGIGNSFSGGVTFTTGRIYVSHDQALGTGLFTIRDSGGPFFAVLMATAGSAAAPLVFNNQLNLLSSFSARGAFKFDYTGTSTLTGNIDISQTATTDFLDFGKDHVLAGAGGFRKGNRGSYSSLGTIRLEGVNTFTGQVNLQQGTIQTGADSVKDGSNNVISGALGTGNFSWNGGTLAAYSDIGSGIISRRVSNTVTLSFTSASFDGAGDATTLIFDTPTINLRNGKLDWTVSGVTDNSVLSIESQLVDNGALAGGITKSGLGMLELKNGNNQITDGIRLTGGTLLATANGDVTTGRIDAGHNYFGTGQLILDGGSARIATADGSNVSLSGGGMQIDNGTILAITGGTGINTWFDSTASFSSSGTVGTIISTGALNKSNTGTTTSIGVKLVAPELNIQQGTLSMLGNDLLSGVTNLTLSGGTLDLNGTQQIIGGGISQTASSVIDFSGSNAWLTANSLGLNNGILSIDHWNGNATSGLGGDRFIISGAAIGEVYDGVQFTGGYSAGGKVILNGDNQRVLVPLATAYIWDGLADTNWTSANWKRYDPVTETWGYAGNPSSPGDAATFDNSDPALSGKTVNISSGISVGSISFEGTQGQAYTLAGNDLRLDMPGGAARLNVSGNNSPTINSNIVLDFDPLAPNENNLVIGHTGSGVLTINGQIQGPGKSVTKAGDGTLVLNNGTNSFTNGFILQGGTVHLGVDSTPNGTGGVLYGPLGSGTFSWHGGALQADGSNRTLDNALDLSGSLALAGSNSLSLNGTSGVLSGNTTLNVIDPAATLTINSTLSGSASLGKTGAGTLSLTDANSYSGGTSIAAGIVQIGDNAALGTGTVSFTGNATLQPLHDNMTVANAVNLGSSATATIAGGAYNSTMSGVIDGAGALNKTGSGTLTLSGNSSYSGGTTVAAGTVSLTNANGAGAGNIAVNSGSNLALNFSNGTLDNTLSGSGNVAVNGLNIVIDANNSAFTGNLNIASGASASVNDASDLGGSHIALIGGLTVAPASGDFAFNNALSGTGQLSVAMGAAGDTFSFGSGTGNTFSGTAIMGQGIFALNANASNTLTNATLQLNSGNTTAVSTGAQHTGNLTFNGGSLSFGTVPMGSVSTGVLTVNSGSVRLDQTTLSGSTNLLVQDDGVNTQLISAASVSGDVTQLQLQDLNGNPLSAQNNIVQGGNTVAVGTYSRSLSASQSGAAGLYVSYQLDALNLQAGQTLSLNEGTGTGTAAELKALVNGAGNLSVNANSVITISNAGNTYSGNTTVASGTLRAGATDVFKNTGNMIINAGSTLDMNSLAQQLNNLSGAGNLTASASLTANNSAASTFSGVISGSGNLTKTGSGTLTLSGNNSYGTSTITGGTLKLANAQAAGSNAVSVTSPGTLELAFNNASFANTISGNGTSLISGNNVTLAGSNSGFSGLWDITGSAIVANANNLGSAAVKLDGTGSKLSIQPTAGNYSFANALTGNGTLFVALANSSDTFSAVSSAGNSFTGTVQVNKGLYTLDTAGASLLTQATLKLDSAGRSNVDANRTINALAFNGGTLGIDMDGNAPKGMLTVGNLDTTAGGTVALNVPTSIIPPVVPTQPSFFEQDSNATLKVVNATGSVSGIGSQLTLNKYDGVTPVNNPTYVNVNENSALVAIAKYDYTANVLNDGLWIGYGLEELNLQSGQTLTLENAGGSNILANTLGAKLTGSGSIAVHANGTAILANAANDYTGDTTVSTGTLKAGTDNALGATSVLNIASGAGFNLNGMTQSIGKLDIAAGGRVDLDGTLHVVDSQRAPGDTVGGSIGAGTLYGTGNFVIDPSIVHVNGVQSGYTGNVTVTGGSQLIMNNAGAFDNVAGIMLASAADIATFGDESSYNAAWTGVPNGNTAAAFSGLGTVQTRDGAAIVLTGNSGSFAGIFDISAGTSLTASAQSNLGSAAVHNAGEFTINTATDWTLNNQVSGSGDFVKNGNGELTLGQNNSAGNVNIKQGTLNLGGTSLSGVVSVQTNATLGGVGQITGDINNLGTLAIGNALTNLSSNAVGQMQILGNLANSGMLNLAGGSVGNSLKVTGNYAGNNGLLTLNTVLGDDSSATDKLIVGGNTSGQTGVIVNNLGGAGAQTVNGIQVVQVGGLSNGNFTLTNRVVAGAYEYKLLKGSDGDWYLSSATDPAPGPGPQPDPDPARSNLRPEIGAYLGNQSAATSMFVHTLHDRLGAQIEGSNAWIRVVGNHTDSRAANGRIDMNTDIGLVHFGADLNRQGGWRVGLMAGYGNSRTDASAQGNLTTSMGQSNNSKGTVDGYDIGMYATWLGQTEGVGAYFDTWLQTGWYHNQVSARDVRSESYSSRSVTGSIEGGYAFQIGQQGQRQWLFEPQVQVLYSDYRAEQVRADIDSNTSSGITTRLGARLSSRSAEAGAIQPFIEANWWHGTTDNSVTFTDTTIKADTPKDRAELKAGLQGEIAKGWQVWGHVGGQWGDDGYRRYEGMVGFKYLF